MKRVVIVSDLHCGHRVGLTPPSEQYKGESDNLKKKQCAAVQKAVWKHYKSVLESLKPIDILICNGDAIDGKGERSEGTEELESDRKRQAEIASQCLRVSEADKYFMTYGTPYHSGKGEDFEEITADLLGAEIKGHLQLDVNGLLFDCKHKIGSSTIPHGRFTAIARESLWNELWSSAGGQDKADVIIRSHVHYHVWAGSPGKLMVVTPALQGFGSKYGVRQCSGIVNIGLVSFDIEDKEHYTWGSHIMDIAPIKPSVIVA